MPVAPYLQKSVSKKLRELNPHLCARWNGHYEKWDIWFNDKIKIPYIVLRTSSIGAQTYQQVRYALWISQQIKYHIQKGLEQSKEINKKRLKDEEDEFYRMGMEVAPLLRSLANAGNSSHGRSVTMFPGIGTGIAI